MPGERRLYKFVRIWFSSTAVAPLTPFAGHCSSQRNAVCRYGLFISIDFFYTIWTGHSGHQAPDASIGRERHREKENIGVLAVGRVYAARSGGVSACERRNRVADGAGAARR